METIKDAIERLVEQDKASTIVAKVTAVDPKAMTCDCSVEGQPDYLDCRLMPTISTADTGAKVVPKEGSFVVLGFEKERQTAPLVLMVSEVQDYNWKIEGRFSFRNTDRSLKQILLEILSAIETLTVSTGVGPSGVPLTPTMKKLEKLKESIDELMEK